MGLGETCPVLPPRDGPDIAKYRRRRVHWLLGRTTWLHRAPIFPLVACYPFDRLQGQFVTFWGQQVHSCDSHDLAKSGWLWLRSVSRVCRPTMNSTASDMAEYSRDLSSSSSPSSSSSSPCLTPASSHGGTSPDESLDTTRAKALVTPDDQFNRWRPSYHLQARTGWMNDPCAPCYDPKTGLYHVYFQWNPKSADWGDISWGSATSKDMVTWTLAEKPTLSPDMPYDCKGVFTGCMLAGVDETLTCFYTSVSHLPIHYTLPHPHGCESLSMASSRDGGQTWQKFDQNPILSSEPEDLQVSGWRDPFIAPWPQVCQILGRDQETTLFGLIAGGIPNVTPTAFLYAIDKKDITKWEYIGPLFYETPNIRLSRWSGDLGKNWEVANFLTLMDEQDESVQRDLLFMGTEGCLASDEAQSVAAVTPAVGPTRPLRQQLWMSGDLVPTESDRPKSGVALKYTFGGHLDYGCMYAANSFYDPVSKKTLIWGWITEEDLCDELRAAQGWSGIISLPRELFLQTTHHVVGACASPLSSITSFETTQDKYGSFTMRTLATRPAQSVVNRLRLQATARHARPGPLAGMQAATSLAFASGQVSNTRWNLECSIKVSKTTETVGLVVLHSPGKYELLLGVYLSMANFGL